MATGRRSVAIPQAPSGRRSEAAYISKLCGRRCIASMVLIYIDSA
jgi:hypothetical protein